MKRSALPLVRGVYGAGPQVLESLTLAERLEGLAAVGEGIVRHEAAHADAVPTKPCERAPEKRGHRGPVLIA